MYSSKDQLQSREIYTIGIPSRLPFVSSIAEEYVSSKPELSMVIPVYNEGENVIELYNNLYNILSGLEKTYEIIFVDDGSIDDTFEKIKTIPDSRIRVIKFQRNYGKAAALSCGFKKSKGDLIITMD